MRLHRKRTIRAIAAAAATAAALFAPGCGSGEGTIADCYFNTRFKDRALPVFELYLLNAPAPDASRLDVYLRVPYARLRFAKNGDRFTSTYSVTFILRDDPGAVLQTRDVERTVQAASYDESVSGRSDAFLQSLSAPPGEHLLEVLLTDEGSGLQYRKRQRVMLRDFSGGRFAASGILFIQRAAKSDSTVSLTPAFISELSRLRDSIGMFQELYRLSPGDTVRTELLCRVPRSRGGEPQYLYGRVPYDTHTMPCAAGVDSVLYKRDSLFVVRTAGIQQLLQFYPPVPAGESQLVRRLLLVRGAAAETLTTISNVLVHDPGYPRVIGRSDMTEAVAYIATEEEVDSLRAAKTDEDFQQRLALFWGNHGGATRRHDFESRLAEANELFTTCVAGWKTPMGITYIVCGAPDAVSCQGAVTEAWSYAVGNQALTIVFRQDYRVENATYFLIPPFSVDDYLWEDFVDRWRRK